MCKISVSAVIVKKSGSKNVTQNSITKEFQSLIAVCESIWRVRCMRQRLQQIASVSELITNTTFKHFVAIQQSVQLSLWVADIPQQGRPWCLQCFIPHLKNSTHCRQDILQDYETYGNLGYNTVW